MPDIPELTTTDQQTITERVRAAWLALHPTGELPGPLRATEQGSLGAPGLTAITLADRSYSGLLVALWLDPAQSGQLAIPGGEPADALHLTLAYVPDMAGTDDVTLARIVASLADVAALSGPITGRIGGFGRFYAGESSDNQDCFVALPDIGMLDGFRESVLRALGDVWVYPGGDHSYQPHITLSYLAPKAKTPAAPPAIDLTFPAITVIAGDRRIDIPFSSNTGPDYIGMYDGDLSYAYYAERTRITPQTGKAKEAWRFSSPRTFAVGDDWIQALPAPGTYHHAYWGTLSFTPDRYERMLANFQNAVYAQTLPVNTEHDLGASGAIGWIGDMRIGADGSIEVKVDWNDRGRALLDGDRFRYVSAELWDEWQDPVSGAWVPDIFSGMAICTRPHFKTDVLRPLMASESAASMAGTARQEQIAVGEKTEHEAPSVVQQFSEQEITAFREFQTLGGAAKLTELTGQITVLSEKNSRLEAEARKQRFTAIVRGRAEGSDGTAWPGEVEPHVTMLTDLALQFGDDSEQVARYIEINQQQAVRFAEATKELFSARGTGRGGEEPPSVMDQIEAEATKLREADRTLTHAQAIERVYSTSPRLKAAYQDERRRNRSDDE